MASVIVVSFPRHPKKRKEETCTLVISLALHPLGEYDIPTGVFTLTYL
jgi:hypothetical protein